MAGWSLSSSSSSSSSSLNLNLIEVLRKLQSVGFCLDLPLYPSDSNPQKLSSVFNRILSVFLQEIQRKPEIRPVPPMLGDGQAIDLFKLYWLVQDRGGAHAVAAEKGGWNAVSEAAGFGSGFGSSLKLVYVKYLGALERWLEKVMAKKEKPGAVVEAKKEEVKAAAGSPVSGPKKNHFLTPVRDGGRRLKQDVDDDEKDSSNGNNGNGNGVDDDGDDEVVIIEPKVANGEESSSFFKKRKRDALVGMLDWVLRVAKNPSDPTIGKVLSMDGGNDKGQRAVGVLYSQVLSARQAMFFKKMPKMDVDSPNLQKGPNMHPSIYKEHSNAAALLTSEKLRYSPRLHSSNKQLNSNSCLEASITRENRVVKVSSTEDAHANKRKSRNSCPLSDLMNRLLPKGQKQQRVPVGSFFQAEVPAWTGKAFITRYNSDDLKWLGTPIWPPDDKVNKQTEKGIIGKGRQESCRCEYPNSVECIRFHVAEERFWLKRELGSPFYNWKFDCMGEEVALSWTDEETRKFKEIVYQYPTNQNFWDQLGSCFPLKKRKDLVSYYFNVFVLACRSYQNRVTPNSIDSDDEETEFGFLSNPLGYEATKIQARKSILCAENTQCVDLDD